MLEDEIFKKAEVNFNKVQKYGFKKTKIGFKTEKTFMDGLFKANILIDKQGKVSGSVYDIENGEEYLPLRLKHTQGGYSGDVRAAYEKILRDVLEKCFDKKLFVSNQANRITGLIYEKFGSKPDFPWTGQKTASDAGVFRKQSGKWFALIMNIKKDKLQPEAKEDVDIINLKIDSNEIEELIKKDGFYPAYHMNKKSWITLVLDDTLDDKTILKYIVKSFNNVK